MMHRSRSIFLTHATGGLAACLLSLLNACNTKQEPRLAATCEVSTTVEPRTHFCVAYANYAKSALAQAEKECGDGTTAEGTWVLDGSCPSENRLAGTCVKSSPKQGDTTIYFYPDYDAVSAERGCQGSFGGTWAL